MLVLYLRQRRNAGSQTTGGTPFYPCPPNYLSNYCQWDFPKPTGTKLDYCGSKHRWWLKGVR